MIGYVVWAGLIVLTVAVLFTLRKAIVLALWNAVKSAVGLLAG